MGLVIEVEEKEEEERQEEGFDLRKRGRTRKRGKEREKIMRELIKLICHIRFIRQKKKIIKEKVIL